MRLPRANTGVRFAGAPSGLEIVSDDGGMIVLRRAALVSPQAAFDALSVEVADGAIKITEPAEEPETFELWPPSPARFVRPGDFDPLRYEFHRNAYGTVHLLVVDRGSSRLYYRSIHGFLADRSGSGTS